MEGKKKKKQRKKLGQPKINYSVVTTSKIIGEHGYTWDKALDEMTLQRDKWLHYLTSDDDLPAHTHFIHSSVEGPEAENRAWELANDYVRILREEFHQGLSRGQLLKMDYVDFLGIDSQELERVEQRTRPVVDYLKGVNGPETFYYIIPPFEECVFRSVKPDEGSSSETRLFNFGSWYFHIQILELVPDERRIRFYVESYIMNSARHIWVLGPYGTFDVRWLLGAEIDCESEHPNGWLMEKVNGHNYQASVYLLIPPKYLVEHCHWSVSDYGIFNDKVVIPMIHNFIQLRKNGINAGYKYDQIASIGSDFAEMARSVIALCQFLNGSLDMNKPKIKREKAKTDGNRPDLQSRIDQPKKVTRTVGYGLTVRSTKSPTRATYSNLKRYRVAVWKRRAHKRRLPNGNVIWIGESECHRKFLDPHEEVSASKTQVAIEVSELGRKRKETTKEA